MGPAHATVSNQTMKPICIITFNMADLIYKTYHTLYIVEPGENCKVEANPDAIGLKVGLVYDTKKEKQELLFHRFTCSNDSVLTITDMEELDVQFYGDGVTLNSKGKLRESSVTPFNMAADTLHTEVAVRAPPSKAVTEIKAFAKKVVDTSENMRQKVVDSSETIITKAAAVIEHPVEFIKAGGHVDEMPSVVAAKLAEEEEDSSDGGGGSDDRGNHDNYGEGDERDEGNSNYNSSNNGRNNNKNNFNGNNNRNDRNNDNNSAFGSPPAKNQNNNGKSNNNKQQQKQNNKKNNKQQQGKNNKQQGSPDNKSGRQSPSNSTYPNSETVDDDASRAAAAEKWEAELQRVKNEKKWEAELARIKRDRQQEAEDEERRLAEEAEAAETLRMQPQPKHRKKNGSPDDGGVEVVSNGCSACIVS